MRKAFTIGFWGVIFLFASVLAYSQRIETINGVRVVHNEKGGKLGNKPGVSIQLIRKIGDVDTTDENLAFNYPSDIAMDSSGNIYVLDSANNRIQKFDPEGKYLATFGRKGQGPGEFYNPDSIDIDANGFFYVLDTYQNRIQTMKAEGAGDRTIKLMDRFLHKLRCLKSGLLAVKGTLLYNSFDDKAKPPKLIKVLDQEGKILRSFAAAVDFGDGITSSLANAFDYVVDKNDNFCLSYAYQNQVEKYAPDGKLLWKADRPLNYASGVLKRGKMERVSSGGMNISSPEMNICSAGIAVDDKSRMWVVTLSRQLRKEEKVQTSSMIVGGVGGISNVSRKTEGNTDLRTTDAYKLEIFDSDGVLLGEIPLTHFVNSIRIIGDNLFLLDQERGVTFYQYKIIEK
ncbi:MAG: 6-bladed beta-propeller [Candidatus Aminicenantes bacterium]|nr:6-bladed beta-propeller [Candidatus Aminicenantes bacterium]